ncbi:MAG TPA: HK97 family phage prohead protease [Pseudonocardiaceae bacterium]
MGELHRSFTPDLEVRSGGDGRTIVGIAVPYGRPQRIDAGLTEQFARGAFSAQLRAAHRVRFAREHVQLGGSLIGATQLLRDDAAGLYGEWRVSRTALGDETLELVRDGALRELSIGFREGQNRRLAGGVLERVSATLTEVAVVQEGAYGELAAVAAVRSADTGCSCGGSSNRDRAAQILAGLPVLPATPR